MLKYYLEPKISYQKDPDGYSVGVYPVEEFLEWEDWCIKLIDLFKENYRTHSKFIQVLRQARYIITADEWDGDLIGFIVISGALALSFDYVSVVPEWRHKGVARAMLLEAIDFTARNHPEVNLVTLVSKEELKPLYTGVGFRVLNAKD